MGDLIQPLTNIANFNQIPQTHIDELITKYRIISEEAIPQMNSRYKDIIDYTSYVYCIYDTIKHKWYIGVRYGRHRYNKNNLQDLLQYQSSSKDIIFKNILKYDILNNTNRFVLSILKEFNDEFHATLYEAMLHQIFQVGQNADGVYNPHFYNRTAEYMNDYKVYMSTYWDLQDNIELSYADIQERGISYSDSLKLLCVEKILVTENGRYCLKSNLLKLSPSARRRFENITLYKLYEDGVIDIIIKQYWEWVNILGKNFHELVNGYSINKKNNKGRYSIDGYFYYKEKVDEAYKECIINNELISLHHHDTINISVTTKTYKAWKDEIGKCFVLMMNNSNGTSAKGYFRTVKACEDDLDKYTIIDMFSISDLQIVSESKTKIEWCKFFNIVMFTLNMKKLKNHSIRGYHFSIDAIQRKL